MAALFCGCCTSVPKGERSVGSAEEAPPLSPKKVVVPSETVPPPTTTTTATRKAEEEVKEEAQSAPPPAEKAPDLVVSPPRTTQMMDVLQNSPMLKALAESAGFVEESSTTEESTTAPAAPAEVRPEIAAAVADLKGAGIAVKKHSFNGTVRPKVLGISDDETKQLFKEKKGLFRRSEKEVDLKDVKEVRPATALDPETVGLPKRPKGMVATPTLRRTSEGPAVARKAFSLILPDGNTVDLECDSPDQCATLVAAFELLVAKAKKNPPLAPPTPSSE
mmetsp:Transcript_4096/g.13456  ORF Transcript_4096/g.13456 Transcript_4096/m.13456 type:complete len:277 (+) Transcript_4096:43-873(+)